MQATKTNLAEDVGNAFTGCLKEESLAEGKFALPPARSFLRVRHSTQYVADIGEAGDDFFIHFFPPGLVFPSLDTFGETLVQVLRAAVPQNYWENVEMETILAEGPTPEAIDKYRSDRSAKGVAKAVPPPRYDLLDMHNKTHGHSINVVFRNSGSTWKAAFEKAKSVIFDALETSLREMGFIDPTEEPDTPDENQDPTYLVY